MPTHIFSAQLQLKDAVLETIAEIVVTAPQVTNFSRRLQAGKIEISRPNDGEKDLFLLGMPFQENMNIRQGGRGDTYNGYCWGLTDDKGYLYCDYKPSTITLTVNGSNIRRLVVFGDKRAEQWAIEAYRDGNPEDKIYSDDVEWAIQWDKPASTHSVTFTRWNRANYNACITSVKPFGDTISFLGPSTLRHFETLTQITPRPDERYYGVTPNRGQLEVVARGEIKDYIEDGIISDELLGVKILRDNEVIATHNVSDSNYDMHSKILTLDLTDSLSRWGVLKYPGRGLTEETDAFSLLVEVMSSLGYSEADVERMCVKEIAVGTEDEEMTVAEYLKAIRIPYPYLEPATYRATIEKICVLGQLCCYSDPNGFPVFVSGRPRPTKAERASVKELPIKGQTSPLRMGIIKKNRVKRIEVEVNNCDMNLLQLGSINFNGYNNEQVNQNFNSGNYIIPLENKNSYHIEISEYNSEVRRDKYATFTYQLKGNYMTLYDNLRGDYSRDVFKGVWNDDEKNPKMIAQDRVFTVDDFSELGQLKVYNNVEEFKNAFRYQDDCAVGIIKNLSSDKTIALACRIRFTGIVGDSPVVGVEYVYNAKINIAFNNLEREKKIFKASI